MRRSPKLSIPKPEEIDEGNIYYDMQKRDSERQVKAYKKNIESSLHKCGIPLRYIHASKKSVDLELWEKMWSTLEMGKGILLSGGVGVGKTFLAASLIKEIIYSMEPTVINDPQFRYRAYDDLPVFITSADLLMKIRESFKEKSRITESDIIEKYSDVEYLFLDDLGVEKPSEWVLQTLYTLIDHRYCDTMTTVITSNLSLDAIGHRLGDRIASRLAEMCEVISIKGEDRRLTKEVGE